MTQRTNGEPTPRQRELLEFMKQYIARHGYPPTLREMSIALGIGGPTGAVCHLKCLEKKGLVCHTERRGRGQSPAWMLASTKKKPAAAESA
jgi:repressor LexA